MKKRQIQNDFTPQKLFLNDKTFMVTSGMVPTMQLRYFFIFIIPDPSKECVYNTKHTSMY